MGGLSSALQKSKRTCNNTSIQLLYHPHQYLLHYSQQYFLYCLNHRLPHSFIPTPLITSTTLTRPPQRPPPSPLFHPSYSPNNHVPKIQKIYSNPFPKKMHIPLNTFASTDIKLKRYKKNPLTFEQCKTIFTINPTTSFTLTVTTTKTSPNTKISTSSIKETIAAQATSTAPKQMTPTTTINTTIAT